MPRQNNRKADCIFTADFHLRDDVPECRTDDYLAARNRKTAWLRDLQARHGCPIVDAGDVFNRWQVSSELEGWALLNLPPGIVTVPGNHDLPQHSLRLYKKSSLHVLEAADKIRVLSGIVPIMHHTHRFDSFIVMGFPYGSVLNETAMQHKTYKEIAIVHAYVAETVPPFIEGYTPAQLLAALPGYDVIVSGHNHAGFDYGVKDRRGNQRLVVNPGSMMRTTADQADYRPRVYLWYAAENEVLPEFYPIEADIVSREHLDKREARDERMSAFVDRLDAGGVEAGLSFRQNVERFLDANKTDDAVRDKVWEALG